MSAPSPAALEHKANPFSRLACGSPLEADWQRASRRSVTIPLCGPETSTDFAWVVPFSGPGLWSARGAQFLTPPKQHQYETRCYIRDPDGHLIEVGQTTDPDGDWSPAHWPSTRSDGEPE